ncbi:pyridoxamine 5'-phosphate oxidase family protein [Streptomyces sp. NPDC059740]|uniref:pyridoxamine 5'-phosphate oxidase family protein n=1 Tax=Streptomyces sp. NPDC059740 TaxID=3346926 RepID=UPI00364653C9
MGIGPLTDLDPDYSSPDAAAVPWADASALLREAELYWLSTVRPDARPHVTPLIGVLDTDEESERPTLCFATGPAERKARNLHHNPHCVLTTGRNELGAGFDVVVEGEAVRVTDGEELRRLAALWEEKYGASWHYEVADELFVGVSGIRAEVFAVHPVTAFCFARGEQYAQTRYRFGPPAGGLGG